MAFADVYYQTRGSNSGSLILDDVVPNGRPIPGAYNRFLDDGDELPDEDSSPYETLFGAAGDHEFAWRFYLGTVLGALASNVPPPERSSVLDELTTTGYAFSRRGAPISAQFTLLHEHLEDLYPGVDYAITQLQQEIRSTIVKGPEDVIGFLRDSLFDSSKPLQVTLSINGQVFQASFPNLTITSNSVLLNRPVPNFWSIEVEDVANRDDKPHAYTSPALALPDGQWKPGVDPDFYESFRADPVWTPIGNGIFNGDFEYHNIDTSATYIPGWVEYPGGGEGEIEKTGGNTRLKLFGGQEAAKHYRTHNSLFVPQDAAFLEFDLDALNTGTLADALEVRLGGQSLLRFDAATSVAGQAISLAPGATIVNKLRVAIPPDLRGLSWPLTLSVTAPGSDNNSDDTRVYIDNLKFVKDSTVVTATGDVALVDLRNALADASEFQLLPTVTFIDRSGNRLPLQMDPSSRGFRLSGGDAGYVLFSQHVDGSPSPTSQSGRFYFAPGTRNNLPGDIDGTLRGFQGTVEFQYQYLKAGDNALSTGKILVIVGGEYSTRGMFAPRSADFSAANVTRIQQRLRYLGFPGATKALDIDGVIGPETRHAIGLFNAATSNTNHTASDSVNVKELNESSAPRWTELPTGGLGWLNLDTDNRDWGTSWTLDVISAAGLNSANAPLQITDISLPLGGNIPNRDEFEAGMDVEVDLPSGDLLNDGTWPNPFYRVHSVSNNRYVAASTAADPTGANHVIRRLTGHSPLVEASSTTIKLPNAANLSAIGVSPENAWIWINIPGAGWTGAKVIDAVGDSLTLDTENFVASLATYPVDSGSTSPSISAGTVTQDANSVSFSAHSLLYLGEANQSLIHWPNGASSGVTVGSGYDIGNRTAAQVVADLTAAGMSEAQAQAIAAGVGKKGTDAQAFVATYRDSIGEISQSVRDSLLAEEATRQAANAKGIATSTTPLTTSSGDYLNARGREIKDNVPAGTYVLTDSQWNALHPAMVALLTDLKYNGGFYLYDRVAQINKRLIQNHGDQLAQFRAVATLFEKQPGETLSYMDRYSSSPAVQIPLGNTETFYNLSAADLAGASARRTRIRLAFLKTVIKALEQGRTVNLGETTASNSSSGFDYEIYFAGSRAAHGDAVVHQGSNANNKDLLTKIEPLIADNTAIGYNLETTRTQIASFANVLTAQGASAERIWYNDPRTWDIEGIPVAFAPAHAGYFQVEIAAPSVVIVPSLQPDSLLESVTALSQMVSSATQEGAFAAPIPLFGGATANTASSAAAAEPAHADITSLTQLMPWTALLDQGLVQPIRNLLISQPTIGLAGLRSAMETFEATIGPFSVKMQPDSVTLKSNSTSGIVQFDVTLVATGSQQVALDFGRAGQAFQLSPQTLPNAQVASKAVFDLSFGWESDALTPTSFFPRE